MSSDPRSQTDLDEVRSDVDTLVKHTPNEGSLVTERVSTVRAQLDEYERAGTDKTRRDTLSELESELESLRDDIEKELSEGRARAHEIVDDIEQKLKNL